jgi:hypothetical protein
MENRGIKIPNSNIVYIIQIPETASQDQVDYQDAIIMAFDDAYNKLQIEMDALCKDLYVGATVSAKERVNSYLKSKGEIK